MTTLETIQTHTLAQRLAEGRIPAPEAFRYAIQLAEALRPIHDSGGAHGAVAPANIAVTESGLELLPAPVPAEAITAYTAPEVLEGRPPEASSDVFSLGAVFFEMLTGRRAFEGSIPEEAAGAILMGEPPSSGSPAVDRFLGGCLAKEPAARLHPVQKISMALKLLSVRERCAEAAVSRRRATAAAVLRAEMQQVEGRMTAQLQAHEKAMSDMQSAVSNALDALREQFHAMGSELAAAQDRAERGVEAFGERLTASVQQIMGDIGESLARVDRSAGAAGEQAMRVAQSVGAVDERMARLEQSFEQTRDAHAVAIEAERMARAQTDDMVERVVEALELLQSTVLDQVEERPTA